MFSLKKMRCRDSYCCTYIFPKTCRHDAAGGIGATTRVHTVRAAGSTCHDACHLCNWKKALEPGARRGVVGVTVCVMQYLQVPMQQGAKGI